jgi:hypothetical protein
MSGASWLCVACGNELVLPARVGRRDTCPGCGAELRSCRQCGFYDPSSYNACREPQADRVLDKERANFCEYFQPAARAAVAARGTGAGWAAQGAQGAQTAPDTPRASCAAADAQDARARLDALFRKR